MSICFYGVFRNEERHLPAMLAEMEPFTDTYAFLLGGMSTDTTPHILRKWLRTHDGTIVQQKTWQGIERAQNAALRLGRDRGADYVFTAAGGEITRQKRKIPKLTLDWYPIRRIPDGTWVSGLVRSELPCHWEGLTHTGLVLDANGRGQALKALEMEDVAYDDNRQAKLERDRRLLERNLLRHPGDSRTLFYLGETYRCLGDRERAVAYYRQRALVDTYEEERWYAETMAAALMRNTHLLLKAHQARPGRAEPLRELAGMYADDPDVAALFTGRLATLPLPEGDIMRVNAADYAKP